MMRELTSEEIERFANQPGAERIAVEKFLMTMGNDITVAMGNLGIDAKEYGWNRDTIDAILDGMWLATKLEDEDFIENGN